MIKAKSFPCNTNLVSEKAFANHIELYREYCVKCNEIYNFLKTGADKENSNKNFSVFRNPKVELGHNLNATMLHESFFGNIGKTDNSIPQETFLECVNEHFGGYEEWQKCFVASAKANRGWVVTALEQRTGMVMNYIIDNHDKGVLLNSYPILILDCWEHAYMEDYGNDVDSYIEHFIKVVRWDVVEKRCEPIAESRD